MAFRSLVLTLTVMLAAAFACGENAPASTSAPEASPAVDTPFAPTSAPDNALLQLAPVAPPPLFKLADYSLGEEVTHLMDGIGPERDFPPELLPTSPEMTKEDASARWREFFRDSRVFYTKLGEIWEVRDLCERTSTYRFSPHRKHGGNWYIGYTVGWSVEAAEFGDWHGPRLVETNNRVERVTLLSRGWSGVSGGTLIPPDDGAPINLLSGDYGEVKVRVFDYPGCAEVVPLRKASAGEWEAMGLGSASVISDFLDPDSPQLPVPEVLEAWRQHLGDQLVFHNFARTPHYFLCADGTGIDVGRYCRLDNYGRRFNWRLEDARALAKNAVFLVHDYLDDDGNPLGDLRQLMDLEGQLDPFVAFTGLSNPGCSIQQGLDYLETVPDPRESIP